MCIRHLILPALLFSSMLCAAQAWQHVQYFDGADTNALYSIIISRDTSASNIWQVGPPQKAIFDSAATFPNVMVTDTLNDYPVNDTSVFSFGYKVQTNAWIIAFRWKQKLDLGYLHDMGIVEYSLDSGANWFNIFTGPEVYNVYGFNSANVAAFDSMTTGFTGTDSLWKDIWLCFNIPSNPNDSIALRFTFRSDSVETSQEGWMIDNLNVHSTTIHTVKESDSSSYFKVFPTRTSGLVFVEASQFPSEKHKIERVELIDGGGRIADRLWVNQEKLTWDVSRHPPGMYHLRVFSNLKSKTYKIIINDN